MELTDLTIAELIQGYHQARAIWVCNYCDATTLELPDMTVHLQEQHGGPLTALINLDSKYNTLTATQKELLIAFSQQPKDNEVAEQLGVSASTVRHQKFTFREKNKQAKLYSAQYQAVFASVNKETYLPTPPAAVDTDSRFKITETEYRQTTNRYLSVVAGQLTLSRLPKGQKKIVSLLYKISEEFEFNRHYSQAEIDSQLKKIYPDYVILKRYLIDYGFLARTTDNHTYWRIF